eukprot:31076-Pyramimonas_sp.AAC.1
MGFLTELELEMNNRADCHNTLNKRVMRACLNYLQLSLLEEQFRFKSNSGSRAIPFALAFGSLALS